MRTFALLLLALACTSSPAFAQGEPKSPPTTGRAPKANEVTNVPLTQLRVTGSVHVGESAPDFELPSSSGRNISLSALRGDWVLLHFADDRRAFAGLRDMHADLKEMGVRLIGICKDKPQSLRSMVQREGVPFDLLADPTGEISAIYGLYDTQQRTSSPGFVVVDRAGKVRLALLGQAPPRQVVELTRFTMVGF